MLQRLKTFLFENRTTRQTVVKNTFWLFIGELTGRILRIAVIIYAARVLGTEQWGAFAYATTLAAFFSMFSDIGVNAILTREIAKNHELKDKYLSTAFYIKLALIIVSTALIFFVAPFFTKISAARALLPFVALLFVFDGLREFALSLNRAFEMMEKEATVKILTNAAIVAFGISALIISPTPYALALGYVAGSGFGFLAALFTLREHFRHVFTRFTAQLVRPIIFSAWPFALLGLLGSIMTNTDVIMIGWVKPAHDVGLYSAAQRIVQIFYIIPALVASALLPTFARLAGMQAKEKMSALLERVIVALVALAVPLALGGMVLAPHLIRIAFGAQYLPGAVSLQILFLTLLIMFPLSPAGNAIFAYNQQRHFILFGAIGAIGNVAFNAFLIPLFGIGGAAAATICAQFIVNIFVWRKLQQLNRFEVFSKIKKIAVAGAAMAVFAAALDAWGVNFFMNVALSAALYLGLLALMREPLLKELRSIAS